MVMEHAPDKVERPARKAQRDAEGGRGWYAVAARGGLVAKGASYGLVGVLALNLVFGSGSTKSTSREGALATLADESFGKVVLVLLALGFAGYATWRLVEFVVGSDKEGIKDWGMRIGCLGRGILYGGLTYATVRLLFDSQTQSQNREAEERTATVLAWPAGRWIVAAIGLGIVGVGLWNGYRAISRKFEKKWRARWMGDAAESWASTAGVIGHLARAVVFTLIGGFIVKAAYEFDPDEAIGLDGALQKVAHAAYGPYLLGLVAAGLIAYGLYCLADARYRDVSAG